MSRRSIALAAAFVLASLGATADNAPLTQRFIARNDDLVTKSTPTCATTDGAWTGDGTATWVPSCFGSFLSKNPAAFTIFATRGTTSSNGTYPPGAAGSPISSNATGALDIAQANGANARQVSGRVINFDIVGGAVSQAHPTDAQSPNAVALSIFTHQRPGPNSERPPAGWSLNWDHVISPGSGVFQGYGVEGDLSNFSGDCHIGGGCTSAWYFYGGINAYPNLAFHYIANQATQSYSGTATASGNVLTLASGTFSPLIAYINFGGAKYRVDCTPSTCTADRQIAPGGMAFTGYSAAAHEGFFLQDSANGTPTQDDDFLLANSSRTIVRAVGNHRIGFDLTNDALAYGMLLNAGQSICFNGADSCLVYGASFLNYSVGGMIKWYVDGAGGQHASAFYGQLTTPASSAAACTTGQFADDANYHYVCVATNKWRRVALSDF